MTTPSGGGATQPPLPSADGPSLQGVRVLLVEDDPAASDVATRILRAQGAHVTASRSSAEALTDLASAPPDIIVSDIGMPGEDGYTFIGKVRALPREAGGHVPAIALTALARPEDCDLALRAGFQRHVPKPFEPHDLAMAITELLADTKGRTRPPAAPQAGPAVATRHGQD
jgi:CheY-like chemotaxis protein